MRAWVATAGVVLFAVFWTLEAGCGEPEAVGPPPSLLSSFPANGSRVLEGTPVTLIFTSDPGVVVVNGTTALGAGTSRTFRLAGGALQTISWGDSSSTTLTFYVLSAHRPPPSLESVRPDVNARDDVDPAELSDGLALEFYGPVDVHVLTISTAGVSLDWIATADGNTVTLHPNPRAPILMETRYEVRGTVSDLTGAEAAISIGFTTTAEPL
ncbi:hypothetical protein HN371_23590 [Candidatus Poribacteria bacterium]|jgi:hypothetical protein|nr:hypothetical protein [Candidatus Poribacteria bacterium]MBT5532751.1 hypothetical protein [Candidatus Poribacteria bacterium]MBT5714787.1 hypothetical protein [Candidatus Poribacteria bacterium]MBT7098462.1 hypothetical protein [Candidatus Poribacteria bacterium]MBT7804731.1 hypothetical protein [Candidatus Poribacteria bacterium]